MNVLINCEDINLVIDVKIGPSFFCLMHSWLSDEKFSHWFNYNVNQASGDSSRVIPLCHVNLLPNGRMRQEVISYVVHGDRIRALKHLNFNLWIKYELFNMKDFVCNFKS